MGETKETRLGRYCRQMMLPHVGEAGQERLLASKVVLVGCGGLGCTIGQILARAGVGEITLCDGDTVQLDNLHRQILYDERDLNRPKAVVAAAKLLMINSQVRLHARPERIDSGNIGDMIQNADLVVDATDNLASRYAINAAAAAQGKDWIYGGCVGTVGTVMVVRSRTGACLECVFGPYDPVEQGQAGGFPVLPTTPVIVGAFQAHEVLRYLLEKEKVKPCGSRTLSIDLWQARVRASDFLSKTPGCGACGKAAERGA
jgi:molybdopterin/thiamine biosynthesis adenylyltransferase